MLSRGFQFLNKNFVGWGIYKEGTNPFDKLTIPEQKFLLEIHENVGNYSSKYNNNMKNIFSNAKSKGFLEKKGYFNNKQLYRFISKTEESLLKCLVSRKSIFSPYGARAELPEYGIFFDDINHAKQYRNSNSSNYMLIIDHPQEWISVNKLVYSFLYYKFTGSQFEKNPEILQAYIDSPANEHGDSIEIAKKNYEQTQDSHIILLEKDKVFVIKKIDHMKKYVYGTFGKFIHRTTL
jgi:hypothetical protein